MRIAAIDIGTNSLHMIVCRVRPDLSFEVVDGEKDMVRLGLGMGGRGDRRLADTSMAAAIQTLSKFMRIAASHGVDEIVATATSAVREAENGGEFVAAVQRALGLRIQVITGTEEARLIHLAAVYAVDIGKRPAIVIDIGGGSTEITLGTADRLLSGCSFKIGVIRLTERFVRTDPLSGSDERKLVRHIRKQAGEYLPRLAKRKVDRVIGTSGTILSLGTMALGDAAGGKVRNARVSAKAITRLRRKLVGLTQSERLRFPNMDLRRADLAPAGAVLLDTLLQELGAREITLCDFALREGLVLDYIQKNAQHIRSVERYPDVRRRSVVELGERCNYFPTHAEQVARLALAVFDATVRRHELGPRQREWLEYGALLHDIGAHIGYEGHHRHSYYLIRHGGLRGFEPDEIERIALVARYHRQAVPKKSHPEFAALPPADRRAVRLLSAMVRLAEGLDRSHAQVISRIAVKVTTAGLQILLTRTGDAELEVWAADRHAAPLAALLDMPIVFQLAGRTLRKRATTSRSSRPRPPRKPRAA